MSNIPQIPSSDYPLIDEAFRSVTEISGKVESIYLLSTDRDIEMSASASIERLKQLDEMLEKIQTANQELRTAAEYWKTASEEQKTKLEAKIAELEATLQSK